MSTWKKPSKSLHVKYESDFSIHTPTQLGASEQAHTLKKTKVWGNIARAFLCVNIFITLFFWAYVKQHKSVDDFIGGFVFDEEQNLIVSWQFLAFAIANPLLLIASFFTRWSYVAAVLFLYWDFIYCGGLIGLFVLEGSSFSVASIFFLTALYLFKVLAYINAFQYSRELHDAKSEAVG